MSGCRSCGAEVWWARTATGKAMPVDADPVPDGNVVLDPHGERIDGSPVVLVLGRGTLPPEGPRYTSHFATCPQAARHRRR